MKPSEERVWRKYYQGAGREEALPKTTIYRYLCQCIREQPAENTVIEYYGRRYNAEQVIAAIDHTADVYYSTLGVRP